MTDGEEARRSRAWSQVRTFPQGTQEALSCRSWRSCYEKQYFKRLASIYDVVIEYQQKNESPEHLADFARKLKEEDERDISTDCYEKIWVVVDVDDFHGHSQAAKICKDNGIELIISNPCFEVWLLDHVSVCPPSFTLTSTVESAAAKAGIVGGNRNKYVNVELIDSEHLDAAIRNAERHNTAGNRQGRNTLAPHHEQEYAPWTDMPKVIETLKSNKQS